MSKSIVHKFGGTSLASADCFSRVKLLLNGKNEIIITSAIQGTTQTLQQLLDHAKNNQPYSELLNQLKEKHFNLIDALLIDTSSQLKEIIYNNCKNIDDILQTLNITCDYANHIQDTILGYGEQWSAQIFAAYIEALYLDATQILFVSTLEDNSISIDWKESNKKVLKWQGDNNQYQQLVIPGFIARTTDGKFTTLGRNSSDYSASIFAKLFNAKNLVIWTDVEGIYSADPKRVRAAFPLKHVTYKEAFELAYFGTKVIYPKTIIPAMEAGIPIYIKNTFQPKAEGTCISAKHTTSPYLIRGLASIDDVALINVEGAGMIGIAGIAARTFQALRELNISVILISQASSEHSICFAIRKDQASLAIETLKQIFHREISARSIEDIIIHNNCAIIAAVGEGMVGNPGIAGKLTNTLAQANINIRAIAQGSSERNISVVIHEADVNKALRAVHSGFYLSNKTISIGLIGPGSVGTTLLKQIRDAENELQSKYQVNICVRGIMNTKKMLLRDVAVDMSKWEDAWNSCDDTADLSAFANHILADDIPHAVIIDCSTSQTIADYYIEFMQKGLHVITPNKRANSGNIEFYQQLKTICAQKNRHYLYETTVCAGLPVIKTLQDIVATGDKIQTIEGIVSGTFSYIFSELSKGKLFSEAVKTAKKLSYTETDPRDDLSGLDIARKVVCLARELGYSINLSDIKIHSLIPRELQNCDVDTFLSELPKFDKKIGDYFINKNKKYKLAYICTIEKADNISVDFKEVLPNHPFAKLSGTDNMIIFRTKRYNKQPLIIQGPGAGADVTAAGVFADLLRLISLLNY